MLRKDFQPSREFPTRDEMVYAQDVLTKFELEDIPQDAVELWERADVYRRELAAYMREDTREIVERMLPDGDALTLSSLMDIIHVYYWWKNTYEEPAEALGDFLQDLDESRFFAVAELLHEEFRDLCAQAREARTPTCKRTSVRICLQKSIVSYGDNPADTYASASRRADALTTVLEGIDFSEEIFQSDIAYADADELLDQEDSDYEVAPEEPRSLHSFAELLGRHAVNRLIEAGIDDLEAMAATHVIDTESGLRFKGHAFGEDYMIFRNEGGTLQEFLHRIFIGGKLDQLVMSIVEDEGAVQNMTDVQKEGILTRFLEETWDEWELLEDYYQLEENGIAPYYRRKFAEEVFPRSLRV